MLGWGKLLTLSSRFGRNFILKWFIFLSPWGKEAPVRLPVLHTSTYTPSSQTSSHATLSACALTLSVSAIHHPELKIQGLGLIILLPWWPGCLSCPSAHGRMLQTFTSVQARRIVLCFPPLDSEPPLCRSCWCCTMQLSIKHQALRENQRDRICMGVSLNKCFAEPQTGPTRMKISLYLGYCKGGYAVLYENMWRQIGLRQRVLLKYSRNKKI